MQYSYYLLHKYIKNKYINILHKYIKNVWIHIQLNPRFLVLLHKYIILKEHLGHLKSQNIQKMHLFNGYKFSLSRTINNNFILNSKFTVFHK